MPKQKSGFATSTQLPTFTSATWTVTSLLDSFKTELSTDPLCSILRLFTYAVTVPGWRELRPSIVKWKRNKAKRGVFVYAGTDHALTDPDALRAISNDGFEVRLMREYHGIFHPKVIWLDGEGSNSVWVGSNNLTRDGLLYNIEFATLIKSTTRNPDLDKWFHCIHNASEPYKDALVINYEKERRAFAKKRSSAGTFTWSKRVEPPSLLVNAQSDLTTTPRKASITKTTIQSKLSGFTRSLIVEVMPRETGMDGKQIQLPKAAVLEYFGLDDYPGASKQIRLKPTGTKDIRVLTLTLFKNNTVRLSIAELDYRDRPCVIIFNSKRNNIYEYEIIQKSISPDLFRKLLTSCTNKTRTGSRHWVIIKVPQERKAI